VQRRVSLDAELLIGGIAALFWDPFGNFVQPGFFYNSDWLNLNSWTGFAPGVINPDAGRMPEPAFIVLVYPFGLLAFAMGTNALVRLAARRRPDWSGARILTVGTVGAALAGMALEAPMFLLHLWALAGAPGKLSLFDNAHRYSPVEFLTTGMVFAGWAAVRYFRDDEGRAFTERGVGPGRAMLAMIGWCSSLLIVLQLTVTSSPSTPAGTRRPTRGTSSTACATSAPRSTRVTAPVPAARASGSRSRCPAGHPSPKRGAPQSSGSCRSSGSA
jgi:hypothetical protein